MNSTRTRVVVPFAMLSVATVLAFGQQPAGLGPGFGPPGPPPKLTKVRDDVYFVENQAAKMGDLVTYGGNLTIYLTNAGVIIVDSKNEWIHDDVV